MIELKQYIDNIVLNSNMFFSVAVPIMREINTNIRRLSAHTTIMTYEKLVNTRQRIMESGLLHFLPYQREHIVFRWCLRQRLRYVQLLDFCMRIRTASIWWNGCCLILRLNRCTKQKLRPIIIYEFSLFESKQKARRRRNYSWFYWL